MDTRYKPTPEEDAAFARWLSYAMPDPDRVDIIARRETAREASNLRVELIHRKSNDAGR